ncbi:MAG: hypothetical protein WC710_07675 [Gallionella sp.]|jgi:hypothetical protein
MRSNFLKISAFVLALAFLPLQAFAAVESVSPDQTFSAQSVTGSFASKSLMLSAFMAHFAQYNSCTFDGVNGHSILCNGTGGGGPYVQQPVAFGYSSAPVCPIPLSGSAYVYNATTSMCERAGVAVAPKYSGGSGLVVCDATGICSGGSTYDTPAAACASYDDLKSGGSGNHRSSFTASSGICKKWMVAPDGSIFGTSYFSPSNAVPCAAGDTACSGAAATAAAAASAAVAAARNTDVSAGAAAASTAATNAALAAGASSSVAAAAGQTAAANYAGNAATAGTGIDLSSTNSILNKIDESINAGSFNGASQDAKLGTAMTDNTTGLQGAIDAAVNKQTEDENSVLGFFTLSLPSAGCTPFTNTVHGFPISIDFCKYSNFLRDLIGWLLAIFGAITIYETLLRKV